MAAVASSSPSSGYGSDGIYRSLRPPIPFPTDPDLSMISFIFRKSAAYPDRLAIVDADSGESLSFSQLRSAVFSVAVGLRDLCGVGKGDVVLVLAPNSLHYPVCFLAVLALGAVVTTANPLYTVRELSKQVEDSKPKLIVTVPSLWSKSAALHLPAVIIGSKDVPLSPDPEFPIVYFCDILGSQAPASFGFEPLVPVRQSDVAALLYSSGTTGAGKGVVLTHRNLMCASPMVYADQDILGEGPNTFLCLLPMFHVFGLQIISCAQLQRGNTVVTMARFELEATLRAIEKNRVTHFFCVPPVMIAMAKYRKKVTEYDCSSLRTIACGAAPMGKDVMEDVHKILPHVALVQVIF